MANNDPLNHANFGLLPEPQGRFGSFTVSTVVNVAILVILVLLSLAQAHRVKVRPEETTQLIFPVQQPKPVVPPVPKVTIVPPPRVQLQKLEQTPPKIKIQQPKPVPEPPKTVAMKTPVAMPRIAPAPPKAVAPPPKPKVGLFKSAEPTHVANNRVAPTPKTGGFGDPQGVAPNPNATRPATVAAVGAFDSAPGIAKGAGAARKGSVHGTAFGSGVAHGVPGGTSRGTVASAGFSNGEVGGTPGGHGRGRVASTGFGQPTAGPGGPAVAKAKPVTTTPIIVLSKPLPEYTAEAKREKIQGDVSLEVNFEASGKVQILRVIRGLGHGLDEQAKMAAEHIRFKPATRNGHPVDQVSVIRITFQLA